jgi:sugar phosphate isomerase/epimerase
MTCTTGRGTVDYPTIRRLLDRIGYDDFIAVEQERSATAAAASPT